MEQFELGNTGLDPLIRTANDRVVGRFGHLNKLVNAITALQETPPGSGIQSVVAGTNITVDDTDPLNPIINNTNTSGTWTPTVDGFNNAIGAANIDVARYSRTGNIVTCTMVGSVIVDFSVETSGSFDFTLPIASATYETIGCANIWKPNQCNGIIKFGGRLLLSSADTSFAPSTAVPFYAIFQYEIS